MALAFTLEQLCNVIDPIKVEGNTTTPLSNIGSLDSAVAGDLAFLGNDKYHAQVATCNASAILVPANYTGSSPKENQAYIFVEKPSYTLALICGQIEAALWPKPPAGTHPTAVIAESAKIGKNVHILIGDTLLSWICIKNTAILPNNFNTNKAKRQFFLQQKVNLKFFSYFFVKTLDKVK